MSKYRWIHHEKDGATCTLYDVGILPDGTLHNPRGYPDDDVRCAVLAADERRRQRRSLGAIKAAQTRARRQEKKVHSIAARFLGRPRHRPARPLRSLRSARR